MNECQYCYHWLHYNQAKDIASTGECLNPLVRDMVKIMSQDHVDFGCITPFDWSCLGFEQRVQEDDPNASQASRG